MRNYRKRREKMVQTETARVLAITRLNHRVKRYVVRKPPGYKFRPGQTTTIAVDKEGWRDKDRPFTFTSLPDNPELEFTIKEYPSHDGVTEELHEDIEVGDRLILHDAWGTIEDKGPGVMLAGGAGVAPFISILRQREQDGSLGDFKLFFSNKTAKDVFMRSEFTRMLGDNAVFTLTQEQHPDYEYGRIDRDFLTSRIDNFDQPFYVCGPPGMVDDLKETLSELGASAEGIVFED